MIKRRTFIAGLGSAAVCPVVARAQQADRVRRIGVLMSVDDNPQAKARFSAFTQVLADLGWNGLNVRMDLRWGGGDNNRTPALARDLVGLQPDIIVTTTTGVAAAVRRETRTIPIVAIQGDPVASGLVPRLDRPDGNVTGFATSEASMGGKWIELLSEVAPGLKRAAIMFNPDNCASSVYVPPFETAARALKVVPIIATVHSDAEIEMAIVALGREPRGGLYVVPDGFMITHRATIISAAARHSVPAIYSQSDFAREGGLLSYGPDPIDVWRRAATYVDRILRGAKPGDLPVQFPTKYELVINLKTAKALGLTVPQSILVSADEVIE